MSREEAFVTVLVTMAVLFLGSAATAYMLLVIAILLFALLVFRNSSRRSRTSK